MLRHLVTPKAAAIIIYGTCHRVGRLDPVDLLAARGSDFGVKNLEAALRCDGCGRRGFAQVRVEWV
jgi:hypothetical protein